MFGFLAPPMDGSLMLSVFENSPEKSCIFALERLLFTWKNVVCIVLVFFSQNQPRKSY